MAFVSQHEKTIHRSRTWARRRLSRAAAVGVEALEGRRLLSTTFPSIADAETRAASPTTNFGTESQLYVNVAAADRRESFIQFDLSGVSDAASVVLVLHGGQTALAGGASTATASPVVVGAFGIPNPALNEAGIDWNDRPANKGGALDSVQVTSSGDYRWNLSSYVRNQLKAGNTTIGLALKYVGGPEDEVAFDSRESGATGPQLIVETNTAGPVAAFTAPNITAPAASQTITVVYTDPDGVDVSTIDSSDLVVSKPGDAPLTITAVSVDASKANAVQAFYTVAAPGGGWDSTDNETYTAVLQSGQVTDLLGNPATGGPDAFFVTIVDAPVSPPPVVSPPPPPTSPIVDVTPPLAVVASSSVLTDAGGTDRQVQVTYADDTVIDATSIDAGDITVTRDGGAALSVTDVSLATAAGGAVVTATYTLAAPGGTWGSEDDGTYAITVNAGAVTDSAGNGNLLASGSFDVNIPATPPPLDTGFSGGGTLNTGFVGEASVVQPDGKILVAGRQGDLSAGTSQAVLERFNPNGSLDTTFGDNATGKAISPAGNNDAYYAMVLLDDGSILAAGTKNGDFVVAHHRSNGKQLDGRFNNGKRVFFDFGGDDAAYSLAVAPDGSIIAAGGSQTGGSGNLAFLKLTADGSLDSTFGNHGRSSFAAAAGTNVVGAVVVQPDGKIVAAGSAGGVPLVVRLNTDSSQDTSFGSDGIVTLPQLAARQDLDEPDHTIGLALQPDGKIVVGNKTAGGDFGMARLTAGGRLDTTFSGDGIATADFGGDDDADQLFVQGSGEILALGTTDAGGSPKAAVAAFGRDGTPDTKFGTDGRFTVDTSVTHALALHAGDLILRAFGGTTPGGQLVVGTSNQAPAASEVSGLRRLNVPGTGLLGRFGVINGRNRKLHFLDANNTLVTLSLTAGSGQGFYDGDKVDLVLSGTNAARSSLTISARGGDGKVTLRDIESDGGLKSISAKAGDLSGTLYLNGALRAAVFHDVSGTLAVAGSITSLALTGKMTGAKILAGASLGSDAHLGGSSGAADTFASASIGKFTVKGAVSGSVVGAGLDPNGSKFADNNDRVIGGAASRIGFIFVRGSVDPATRFEAGAFGTIRLPQLVDPDTDAHVLIK